MATPSQSPEDRLQLREVAELLDVTYESAKSMRSRGEFLEASGMFGRTPWWYRWRVEQHIKERTSKQTA